MARKQRRDLTELIVRKRRMANTIRNADTNSSEVLRSQSGSTNNDAVKRLEKLEAENQRLKRLVAEQALDIEMLKEINNVN